MVLLPFLYWYTNEKFSPRIGEYKNYNKFISVSDLPRALIKLIEGTSDAIIGGLFSIVKLLKNRVIIFSILLALTYEMQQNIFLSVEVYSVNLFFIGLILTVVTLIPYVLVNQDFDSVGYLTKNFIMCDIPFALVLFAMIEMFIPQSWLPIFIFLTAFLLILYKLSSQMEIWLQYSKQIIIKQNIDLLEKSSDLVFYIEDMSTRHLGGRKDKIYPMTFFFLTNSSLSKHQFYGVDARYVTKDKLKQKSIVEFNSLPLPLVKRNFTPKEVIGIRIKDGAISLKLLLSFMAIQMKIDPFNLDKQINLFKVEFFEVL
jgi:hypothetical protein